MNELWPDIAAALRACDQRPAVVTSDFAITGRGLLEEIERCARDIVQASGPGRARRILVPVDRAFQTLVHVLAVWSMNGVPVVAGEKTSRSWKTVENGLPFTTAVTDERESLILFTSGSSGPSKAVAISGKSLLTNVRAIERIAQPTGVDRFHVALPLWHAYGLINCALLGLLCGASVHLMPPTTPPPLQLAAIRKDGLTFVHVTPSMGRMLVSFWNGIPIHSVRQLTIGADACGSTLANRLIELFPRAIGYSCLGMTETGPRIFMVRIDSPEFARGAVGKPLPHFEWQLVTSTAGVSPNEASQQGELLLRGQTVFLGYLMPTGAYEGLQQSGWFHTRDAYEIDEGGFFHHRGRIDGAIKVGDTLVHPSRVERVLRSLSGVIDARCRPVRHEILGLVLEADVVLLEGSTLSVDALLTACRSRVEPSAVPRCLRLMDAIPISETGKRLV